MNETSDLLIFWVVVLGRFLIPLTIPRFPLPGVVAALLLDGIDQTIFQTFTNLNLDGYQGYDKALDIYYLTITYISTLRNWSHLFAFRVGRFLWYYRLIGVTVFELVHWRPLLLIFPNTFEYFFIFYEIVRLRWNPERLTKRGVIIAAAAIWIFIKLPQEWWIHIAQLDTTDFIKENLFAVPVDTGWGEIVAANLWVIPILIVIGVGLIFLVRLLLRRLPPAEYPLTFEVNEETPLKPENNQNNRSPNFLNQVLLEKIILVSLVSIIFAQIMPNLRATNLQLAVGTAFVIILNTAVSHLLANRGLTWRSKLSEFGVLVIINFALALLYLLLLPQFDGNLDFTATIFFVLLLSLIVTLFNWYHPIYESRVVDSIDSNHE